MPGPMCRQASLVQDVWLGFEPRLRARRLAPWDAAAVRLLFQLDPDAAAAAAGTDDEDA